MDPRLAVPQTSLFGLVFAWMTRRFPIAGTFQVWLSDIRVAICLAVIPAKAGIHWPFTLATWIPAPD
jgi:hypothetical protein